MIARPYPLLNVWMRDRFWAKVRIPGDVSKCWEWVGGTSSGYGAFNLTRGNVYLAHRLSYIIFYGWPKPTLMVLHKCGNRACVNPQHLYQGNHRDNANDAWRARWARESAA